MVSPLVAILTQAILAQGPLLKFKLKWSLIAIWKAHLPEFIIHPVSCKRSFIAIWDVHILEIIIDRGSDKKDNWIVEKKKMKSV